MGEKTQHRACAALLTGLPRINEATLSGETADLRDFPPPTMPAVCTPIAISHSDTVNCVFFIVTLSQSHGRILCMSSTVVEVANFWDTTERLGGDGACGFSPSRYPPFG